MKRTALLVSFLVLGAAAATAGTFNPARYLADPQVESLNKAVARASFNRDLLGQPYATVVVANVDVYDRFPYLEARYFQVVSDPEWNRLLLGEIGKAPAAYDGTQGTFGALSAPHGLSTDEAGNVYLADTGNDRVLVFRTTSEFDRMTLEPLYAIDNLNKPYDVAYSDGGTPFDHSDDRLYVANTGRNEVRLYAVANNDARLVDAIGELGSGIGHFAGPLALTVGHHEGTHTGDVFVSDAHNGRIVHLRDSGDALAWEGAVAHGLGVVTSLDTDHWGNIYAAAPQDGGIEKFTPTLLPVAHFSDDVVGPRSFSIPFANVTDHRTGKVSRRGQGSGLLVEKWSGSTGIRLLNLGVEVKDPNVVEDDGTTVRLMLTDNASVTATITDPASGSVIARHDAGVLDAGPQTIRFAAEDFVSAWSQRGYHMTITAHSTYNDATQSETSTDFTMGSAGTPQLPAALTSLGNTPNPFNPTTTIRFAVPNGPARDYSILVYDVAGRLVRTLRSGQIPAGVHNVVWDGRNDNGVPVGSGVYLYRVSVGQEKVTGKMVMVK
jgi:hypothetical protein